jgi:EpsI family protein
MIMMPANRWLVNLSLIVILISTLFYLQLSYILELIDNWLHSVNLGHELLLYPISIYLIYRKRKELSQLIPDPSYIGTIIIFLLSVIWMMASYAGIEILNYYGFIIYIPLFVLTITGKEVTRKIIFPLLFPFVALPIWSQIEIYLQDITTFSTVTILLLLEIPVYIEGNLLSLPNGRFLIADVCGGLRFVIATTTIVLLNSYLIDIKIKGYLFYLAVGLFFAVLVNVLRVVTVILSGYFLGMETYLVHDHVTFGWILYAFMMLPFLYVINNYPIRVFRKAKSISFHNKTKPSNPAKLGVVFVVSMISLMLPGSPSIIKPSINNKDLVFDEIDWPDSVGEIKGMVSDANMIRPEFRNSDININLRYSTSNYNTDIYMAVYYSQYKDKEIVNIKNRFYDNKEWRLISESQHNIMLDNKKIDFVEQVVSQVGGAAQYLVWYTYLYDNVATSNRYLAKILQIMHVMGFVDKATIMVASTKFEKDFSSARKRLSTISMEVLGRQM